MDNSNKVYEDNSYMLVDGEKEKKPFYIQYKNLLILLGLIAIVVIVSIVIVNANKNKKCNNYEEKITNAAFDYLKEEELLPTIEGTSVTVKVDDLYEKNLLVKEQINFKNIPCSGTVKITKYKDDYIKTFDLTNCSYCTTDSRYASWSKEISKKPNKNLIDVVAYYNYYKIETYNTNWTKYMASKNVSTEISKYDNYLPLKESDLPNTPDMSIINNIEQETKEYYSYRDKQWKYYKAGGNYSALSSETVEGYPNKDINTEMKTEWSAWSQEYPEVKSYRTIKSLKGYQWYYENKQGNKVYYNNGEYLVEAPDSQYILKSKETVTMYSYQDKMWRWYNGAKRTYSSFTSVAPKGYTNRDDEVTKYTNWSTYKDVSYLNNDNSWYREQTIDIYSKYRITYDIASYIVLDDPLLKDDFEKEIGKSLEEAFNDHAIKMEVIYKFKYRK